MINTTVYWGASSDPDVVGYIIRWALNGDPVDYSAAGVNLGLVTEVALPLVGMPNYSCIMTVGITAVDDLGNESTPSEDTFYYRWEKELYSLSSMESVSLLQRHVLAPADATSRSSSKSIGAFRHRFIIAVKDSVSAGSAEVLSALQANTLSLPDLNSGASTEAVALQQRHLLSPRSMVSSSQLHVTVPWKLEIRDAVSLTITESVSLSQKHSLVVSSSRSLSSSEETGQSVKASLVVDSLTSSTSVGQVSVAQSITIIFPLKTTIVGALRMRSASRLPQIVLSEKNRAISPIKIHGHDKRKPPVTFRARMAA